MAAAGMFASTSYCATGSRPANVSREALASGFKGETSLASAGFKGDSLALKANVCPRPAAARPKSSIVEVSAVLAERPTDALVITSLTSCLLQLRPTSLVRNDLHFPFTE